MPLKLQDAKNSVYSIKGLDMSVYRTKSTGTWGVFGHRESIDEWLAEQGLEHAQASSRTEMLCWIESAHELSPAEVVEDSHDDVKLIPIAGKSIHGSRVYLDVTGRFRIERGLFLGNKEWLVIPVHTETTDHEWATSVGTLREVRAWLAVYYDINGTDSYQSPVMTVDDVL